ncbi:hypothetical protein ACGF0D_42970 [Kitasatospora sp. NPDC048298]|uniref:hypothetical protein n=1 Tax=Kitasatospora sp. NPDC048298 TaxID=3364049 RepID=UPI0037189743
MSRIEKTLAVLGTVTPEGVGYRVVDPITVTEFQTFIREKWCGRVQVGDGLRGLARFTAVCEVDGDSVVITGEIEPDGGDL